MLPDGSLTMLAGDVGEVHPPSKVVIDLLAGSCREAARQGKYKATGIVYDAMTVPPGATAKTDTIAVRLDHADSYSVVVMTPYQRGSGGDVVKGTDFAVQGEGSIFPKR